MGQIAFLLKIKANYVTMKVVSTKDMKKRTLLFLIIFPVAAVVAYAAIGILLFINHNNASAAELPTEAIYTVTFDAGEGRAVDAVQVTTGHTITEPVTTRNGYKFLGWYLNLDDAQSFDFTTEIESNLTLYAKWVEIYTVTFNTCGGTAVDAVRLTSGQNVVTPKTIRAGYALLGWYLDEAYTQKFDFTTLITANTTLNAKWAYDLGADCEFALSADGLSYTITKYNGTCTELAILPKEYNGKPVTAISDHAFEDCSSLTQIIIPENIITVGSKAFADCENLQTIYCEIAMPSDEVPDGWDIYWKKHCAATVVWNYHG